jgi:hypothetical protein
LHPIAQWVVGGVILRGIRFFTGLSVRVRDGGLLGNTRLLVGKREYGTEELHVGVDRLSGEGLGGFLLLALLLDQVPRQGPVAFGLGPEVFDHAVEEALSEVRVELLG